MSPADVCLSDCFAHNFYSNSFDLDIHLKRSDTVFGTRNLKVHITCVVFLIHDVAEDYFFA